MANGHEASHQPTPRFTLGDRPVRVRTLGNLEDMDMPHPENTSAVDEKESDDEGAGDGLGDIVREFLFSHAHDAEGFLPAKLIYERLTFEHIKEELARCFPEGHRVSAQDIHPHCQQSAVKGTPYAVVFSLLCMLDMGSLIEQFIAEGISDHHLPLRSNGKKGKKFDLLCTASMSEGQSLTLSCLSRWAKEYLNHWQWRLTAPFFTWGDGDKALHNDFDPEVVLPWSPPEKSDSVATEIQRGGYGLVSQIIINPECHGFGSLLEKLNLKGDYFALKVLQPINVNNKKQFLRELDHLRRFNGLMHPHLVTLLTSFTQNDRYHFLFPWAECDLLAYYERHPQGPDIRTATDAKWFFDQICGLVGAIETMHNPSYLGDAYGRHGDLKPENILWYLSPKNDKGMLVITDLGLVEVHRETSRSNIPNADIPVTPAYRPPECDIKNGTISRAFDIWTLGCVLLEMCIFILGGSSWLDDFEKDRSSTLFITGVRSNVFYNIQNLEGGNGFAIQVKPEVTSWCDKARAHEQCTQFLLDILDIAEKEMLIVLSDDHRRSSSIKLREDLKKLDQKWAKSNDYWLRPVPKSSPAMPRTTPVVKVALNENAMRLINSQNLRPHLLVHRGKTHSVSEGVLTQR